MKSERDYTIKCLEICMQVNIVEDITTAEDSRQVLISFVGDLTTARRVDVGSRSLQYNGQMSDGTLQQMSRAHGIPPAEVAWSLTDFRNAVPDVRKKFGRTIWHGSC